MNSFLPWWKAALACVRVPDVSPASTITVAWVRALIVMLRSGKNSLFITGPCLEYRRTGTCDIKRNSDAIRSCRSVFSLGYTWPSGCADDRDRPSSRVQRCFMGSPVNYQPLAR